MSRRTFALTLALPALALTLSGCFTPRAAPPRSKAVLEAEARAQRAAKPQPAACPQLAPTTELAFAPDQSRLGDAESQQLDSLAAGLACRPEVTAMILGQSDGRGSEADQHQLAADRAQEVRAKLEERGVPPARLSMQAEGKPPPAEPQKIVILAEGRP